MNGIEAIELMRQGKMVKRIDVDIKFRINNDRVEGMNHSDIWCEEFLFHINANYEECIEPKSLTGWERSEDDEFYIILCGGQTVAECNWDKIDVDATTFYDDANYFSTKEKAEEIAFKQTLFRKLQRFSDNNGGIEIDWNDYQTNKYSVTYYHSENKFTTHHVRKMQAPGTVYFVSREVAEKAIELFHDELIEYFTHDWSGRNE